MAAWILACRSFLQPVRAAFSRCANSCRPVLVTVLMVAVLLPAPEPVNAAPTEQWIPAVMRWSSHNTGGALGFGPTAEAALGEWLKYRIIATANSTPVQACRLPLGQGQSFSNFSTISYEEPRYYDDNWKFTTTLLTYYVTTHCTDPITIAEVVPGRNQGTPILEKISSCPKNTTRSSTVDAKGRPQDCLVSIDKKPLSQPCGCSEGRAPSCCRGNPIDVSTGVKRQQEADLSGPVPLVRTYSSERRRWEHNWNAYVLVPDETDRGFCLASDVVDFGFVGGPTEHICLAKSNDPSKISIVIPPQWLLEFDPLTFKPLRADLPFKLESVGTHWMLRDLAAARYYLLDKVSGKLISVHHASGKSFQLSYSAGLPAVWPTGAPVCLRASASTAPPGSLACVSDSHGRQITFSYVDGALAGLTDPDGKLINYAIGVEPSSKGHVTEVSFQDGSRKQYRYSEPGLSAPLNPGEPTAKYLPGLLTGIVDERAIRLASFQYTAMGQAVRTEHAGVNAFTASGNTVTTPLGAQEVFSFQEIHGLLRPTSVTQAGGAGSAAATRTIEYDSNGNVVGNVGFDGFRTCYNYDPAQGVETSRIEGLPASTSCASVQAAGSTLPAGSRRVSTQWHPQWRLVTRVAAPHKLTSYVYNGQPDPFNGNALAVCAPPGALQADGRPIAVLCRQVEQATPDAHGALGLAAPLQAGEAARENKWTYNALGQVLTHDGPRTDVADITTYAYYTDTTAEHTLGDLATVSNPLGKVTTLRKYNKHGQAMEWVDANGVVTVQTFDLRQRLRSVSVGGQTTGYDLDAVGQVKRINQPDGSWSGFDYDDAHRMKSAYDSLGNRIDYTLDGAGNRTAEQVRDPTGALRRQLNRSLDVLGRVQLTTGRE